MFHRTKVLLLRSLNFLNLLLGDNPSPSLADGQSNGAENARDKKKGNAPPNRKNFLQSRGASLTMVRASTQQTVDRIVGTAVVVGLSVAFVRWLSRPSSSRRRSRIEGKGKENDVRNRNEEDFRETEGQDQIVENNHEEYEHQGSCHCSSIIFVLRGPKKLRAVDSPGKIRYPHIPTPANRFQLVRGESDLRFYYEDDNDDSSSITFDHTVEEQNNPNDASGAHAFCGKCGVHVFHADRSSGVLKVNANCLDGGKATLISSEQLSTVWPSYITLNEPPNRISPSHSLPSLSVGSANDAEKLARYSTIETVSETEPFLGSAYNNFLENLDDRKTSFPRKGSLSSYPTQPESQSTTMVAEGDDLSMGSSSITGASAPLHLAPMRDRTDRSGLPPLPPSRLLYDRLPSPRVSSSDRSVNTMPPQFGERRGYAPAGGIGDGWSTASMESNDLDGGSVTKTTITPRMRDQMKKYMQKYT